MRVFRLVTAHGAVGGTSPLLLSGSDPLEALFPPEPMHSIVVYRQGLAPENAVRPPSAPAAVLGRDPPETEPQFGLLDIDTLDGMPRRAASLTHQPQALRSDPRNMARRASTALLRRSGLRRFPWPTP